MEKSPKLKLIFFPFKSKSNIIMFYKLEFNKNIKSINFKEIIEDIPTKIFKYGKDKKCIKIIFYDNNKNQLKETEFIAYYGYNTVYIQRNEDKGFDIEMIFKNENKLIIKEDKKVFDSLDDIETKYRKKITLINYGYINIHINGHKFSIKEVIEDCDIKAPFYQIAFYDIKNEITAIKPILPLNKLNLEPLIKYELLLGQFENELIMLLNIEDNKEYKKTYYSIYEKYKKLINYKEVQFLLNKPKKYLKDYFDSIDIKFDNVNKFIIYRYYIKHPKTIINNKIIFREYYNKINSFYNVLNNDKELKFYQKIMILENLFSLFKFSKDINSFNKLNIRYYIVSKSDKNSILDKAYNFFNGYISKLTENSKIFKYLLNIDSGEGYYKGDKVYSFDMSNIKMVQSHLYELFPEILLFFYSENLNLANTNRNTGCIAINEYNIKLENDKNNIIYDKNVYDEIYSNEIAMNLVIALLHEYIGYKKFSYSSDSNSPKKIIDDLNNIVELKYYEDKKEDIKDNNEYILTTEGKFNGDSGLYLELGYGQFRGKLITDLILKLKNKGKLVYRADLFTSSSLEILRKFIIYKTYAQELNIKFNFNKNMSIEQEIEIMEKNLPVNIINLNEENEKYEEDEESILSEKNENKTAINNNSLIGKKKNRAKNINKIYKINNKNLSNDNKKISFNNQIEIMEEKEENYNDDSESENDSNENNEIKNILLQYEARDLDLDEYGDEVFEKLYPVVIKKFNFNKNYLKREILALLNNKNKSKNLDSYDHEAFGFIIDYLSFVS